MDFETKIAIRTNFDLCPKSKPLAELFVAEAARQEVTLKELTVAAKATVEAYRDAMDPKSISVKGFEGKAKAALESI